MATYRIAVGRRHKVEPRQIVGALANEGGLSREDFGAIQIRPEFSLVELPADLPRETLERLDGTRISGRLIELRLDTGGPRRRRDGDGGPARGTRRRDADGGPSDRRRRDGDDPPSDKPFRKPRHRS